MVLIPPLSLTDNLPPVESFRHMNQSGLDRLGIQLYWVANIFDQHI